MTFNPKSTEQKTVRKRKTLEELTIQNDYLFKRIMSEKDICIKFVQIILGLDIKDIVYIKTEEVVKELYDSKGIRLDVYLKDEDGVVYNIEMQVTSLDEEEELKDEDFEIRPKDETIKEPKHTFKFMDDEDFEVVDEPKIVEAYAVEELENNTLEEKKHDEEKREEHNHNVRPEPSHYSFEEIIVLYCQLFKSFSFPYCLLFCRL